MLHAIQQNKSKFYRRYHGERQDRSGERRVSEEDEITSTFFGPLDFMSIDNVWRFWQTLLRIAGKVDVLDETIPQSIHLKLWPKRKIEPDGLLTMEWPNGKQLIIVIEIKWHAPLSGDRQLHKQWLTFLTEDERQNAYHLFIAPNISEGIAARSEDEQPVWDTNNHRLILLSWAEVRTSLNQLQSGLEDSTVKRWSFYADGFLEKIGVYRFNGFGVLNRIHLDEPLTINEAVFWNPFKGFSHLQPLAVDTATIQSPLFFNDNATIN